MEGVLGNIRVTIRVDSIRRDRQPRVCVREALVHIVAVLERPAGQTHHPVESTMQVDHISGTGRLVQAIDILRDDTRDDTPTFELRQRRVGGVRSSLAKACPPDMTTGPVTLSSLRIFEELLVRHGRVTTGEGTVRTSVVRNARSGRASRSGERYNSLAIHPFGQGGGSGERRHVISLPQEFPTRSSLGLPTATRPPSIDDRGPPFRAFGFRRARVRRFPRQLPRDWFR